MAKKAKKADVPMACSDCKQRNYYTPKSKAAEKAKLELRKYCPRCRKHTVHKEVK